MIVLAQLSDLHLDGGERATRRSSPSTCCPTTAA
jgi:hypothetical protein